MNKITLGIIGFIILFGGVVYMSANAKTKNATDVMNGTAQISVAPQEQNRQSDVKEPDTQSGGDSNMDNAQGTNLKIEDINLGTGAEATAGKKITVHYTGTLTNGAKFDSSVDRGQPFSFTLGTGEVIQGWDQGFTGMKVGGKRKLTIPPSLGYGSSATGPIPANSTLIFDVELLKVE